MKRYFILGTDTDCGKTYVTCQWLKRLMQDGEHCFALKPVASGCVRVNNQWISEDFLQLKTIADAAVGWSFEWPVSPHLAAAAAGETLSVRSISAWCDTVLLNKPYDVVLIEGAGGLYVPLNNHETWIDFLHYSAISVVLVVGMRLGCINHALLTAHALAAQGIMCEGWIANVLDPHMLLMQENIDTLIARMPIPLLATVQFQGEFRYNRSVTHKGAL